MTQAPTGCSVPGRFHQTYPTVGYVGLLCSATVGHVSHQSCNNVWEPHVEYSNRQGMRYDKPIAGRCHETLVHICTISEHLQLDETATQPITADEWQAVKTYRHFPIQTMRIHQTALNQHPAELFFPISLAHRFSVFFFEVNFLF